MIALYDYDRQRYGLSDLTDGGSGHVVSACRSPLRANRPPAIDKKLWRVLAAKHERINYTIQLHVDWVLKSGRPGVVVICERRRSRRRIKRSSAKG